ncbi:MAG TPA: glutamate-5-semialdehyde dehydrogenase [Spirochaetota bacterium]|nr:glutamate-5-semialdehyde dehydrogenase [Spirochaetota bacterium]
MSSLCSVEKTAAAAKKAFNANLGLLTSQKDKALREMAKEIKRKAAAIKKANKLDLEAGRKNNLSTAMLDRLQLDDKRINKLADSALAVTALPDPVGETAYSTRRPNGLEIRQERVPIGLIAVIFESRPNVVIDIAALTVKSGNAAILRGGKEAIHTNIVLGEIVSSALSAAGLDPALIQVIDKTDRSLVKKILTLDQYIDIVVPRGGHSLIKFVTENSTIPVIKHDKGNCHTFVDQNCTLETAVKVCVNAKVQRPGVCNAMETLLVHKDFPHTEKLLAALQEQNVELHGDGAIQQLAAGIIPATAADWETEYLDLILAVKTVADVGDAVLWINKYGSGHSEAILTNDYNNACYFREKVDAAGIFINASTRFADGNRYGLGAEVGISTQKLHVRGPMGLKDLTCLKYIVAGKGHIVN